MVSIGNADHWQMCRNATKIRIIRTRRFFGDCMRCGSKLCYVSIRNDLLFNNIAKRISVIACFPLDLVGPKLLGHPVDLRPTIKRPSPPRSRRLRLHRIKINSHSFQFLRWSKWRRRRRACLRRGSPSSCSRSCSWPCCRGQHKLNQSRRLRSCWRTRATGR